MLFEELLLCPMKPEDLLQQVRDKETFIVFVNALADERMEAERIEVENPNTYVLMVLTTGRMEILPLSCMLHSITLKRSRFTNLRMNLVGGCSPSSFTLGRSSNNNPTCVFS